MNKHLAISFLSVGVLFCGCDQPAKEEHEKKTAVIEECRKFLSDRQGSFEGRSLLYERLGKTIRGTADSSVRCELVKALVEEILSVDLSLKGEHYQDLGCRVATYENCFECIEPYLFESGLDARYAMDGYFDCMWKLRRACFSVPMSSRMKNEDAKSFNERCYAVWGMMDVYHSAMRWWELRMDQHLQILPAEFRDEYLKRRAPFLKYTSGRKLRDAMMFGEQSSR